VIVVGRGERLAKAATLGAETVDFTAGDPVEAVRELTNGRGAPVVVDAAGTARSLEQAVLMAHKGGRVSVIGIPFEPGALPAQRLVLDEIEVRGVRANRGTCTEVLPLMAAGKVSIRPLRTHTFALSQFLEALDTFTQRKGGAIKVLVKPGCD